MPDTDKYLHNDHFDQDGDGIADKTEEEIKSQLKPKYDSIQEAYQSKDGLLKGIGDVLRYARKTIAGRTTAGKIGSVVKDGLTFFGVLPSFINKGTGLIGTALKTKTMKKDKPKYLSKTVWSAIIIALVALMQALGIDPTADPELTTHIYETVYGLAGAFGLYGLRDAISKQIENE